MTRAIDIVSERTMSYAPPQQGYPVHTPAAAMTANATAKRRVGAALAARIERVAMETISEAIETDRPA